MWGLQNELIYVGANVPSKGDYIGQLIQVDNPAVPGGRSILRWTGALWAPPYGEMIASVWQTGNTPIATVTPGVTTNTVIYSGPAIPAYMTPVGLIGKLWGGLTANNAAGATGCQLGIGPSTNALMPSAISGIFTPNSRGIGISLRSQYPNAGSMNAETTIMFNSNGSGFFTCPVNDGPYPGNNAGIFSPGVNSLIACAKPSSAADQIIFNGASLMSMGNL